MFSEKEKGSRQDTRVLLYCLRQDFECLCFFKSWGYHLSIASQWTIKILVKKIQCFNPLSKQIVSLLQLQDWLFLRTEFGYEGVFWRSNNGLVWQQSVSTVIVLRALGDGNLQPNIKYIIAANYFHSIICICVVQKQLKRKNNSILYLFFFLRTCRCVPAIWFEATHNSRLNVWRLKNFTPINHLT